MQFALQGLSKPCELCAAPPKPFSGLYEDTDVIMVITIDLHIRHASVVHTEYPLTNPLLSSGNARRLGVVVTVIRNTSKTALLAGTLSKTCLGRQYLAHALGAWCAMRTVHAILLAVLFLGCEFGNNTVTERASRTFRITDRSHVTYKRELSQCRCSFITLATYRLPVQ